MDVEPGLGTRRIRIRAAVDQHRSRIRYRWLGCRTARLIGRPHVCRRQAFPVAGPAGWPRFGSCRSRGLLDATAYRGSLDASTASPSSRHCRPPRPSVEPALLAAPQTLRAFFERASSNW